MQTHWIETRMKDINVFQDGKVCRNVPGKILARKDKRIFIEFQISDFSEESGFKPVTHKCWFKRRRRENGGVYECIGWNYWYYADSEVWV